MKKQQHAQTIKANAKAKLSEKQLNWLLSAFFSTAIVVLVFAIFR